ncbi:unnamed protein product [Caenorhabditis brenneri]
MEEFTIGMTALRKNLKRSAECVQSIHKSSQSLKADEMEEVRQICLDSIKGFEELDTETLKTMKTYEELLSEYREKDLDFPETDKEIDKVIAKFAKKQNKIVTDEEYFNEVRDMIEGTKASESLEDSQIEVQQVQHSRKDPISKKDIVNPVIYQPCGHVYDRDSIREFAGKKRNIKCAMQGCSEMIILSKLVDYPDFWNNVKDPK